MKGKKLLKIDFSSGGAGVGEPIALKRDMGRERARESFHWILHERQKIGTIRWD